MSERPRRTGTLALPRQELMRRGLAELIEANQAFRIFLWTMFNDAGIFYPTYSHGSPYDTSFNEGRRAMGLEVLHMLKHVRPDILGIVEREGNLLHREIAAAKPHGDSDALLDDYEQPDDLGPE